MNNLQIEQFSKIFRPLAFSIANDEYEVETELGCLEQNRNYCGNAIELLKKVETNSIPMILTDIPYGVVNRDSSGIRVFDKKDADICNFSLNELVDELYRVCSGSLYIFCSTEQVSELRAGLVDKGMTTRLCIWEKTNPSPVNCQYMWMSGIETCVFGRKKGATFNEHYKNSVWRFPNGRSKRHPTEKPLNLFEYIIKTSSNPGDVILDPFMGSGTTAEAALKNQRNFTGIDISEKYINIANERVEKYLNK